MKHAAIVADQDRKAPFAEHVLPEIEVLLRVARTLTSRPADAEDLVQETLLRAFKAIDRFDGEHARAWLLTIMRNAEINRNRRRRPDLLRDPKSSDQVAGPDPAPENNPESVVDSVLDARIAGALESLQPLFREAVELIDLDGLTYAEAGEVVNVPAGTVMSRVHRGRSQIRKYLEAQGIDLRKEEV